VNTCLQYGERTLLERAHALEGAGSQSAQDSFGPGKGRGPVGNAKSRMQVKMEEMTPRTQLHPVCPRRVRNDTTNPLDALHVCTQDGVYNPNHGNEKDPILTATLQAVLEFAGTISMDLSAGGQHPWTFSIADVVYSLLPSHQCLFTFCEQEHWQLSRIVRNKVVRSCILIELAKHVRSGYLSLFKKPDTWCQESTTTSQWSSRLADDKSIRNPDEGSGGDLAIFPWLGEHPTDDPPALAARRAVSDAIQKGMRHGGTRMNASLLTKEGNVVDGQRVALQNVDYDTARLKAPSLSCMVPLATTQSKLRLPVQMATFLRNVRSTQLLDSVAAESELTASSSSSFSRNRGSGPPPLPPKHGPPTVPSGESFSIPEVGYCMEERTLHTPKGILHCDGVLANTAFALLDLSKKPTKDTTVNVWPGPRCPTFCCPQCKYIESVLMRDVVGRST